MPGNFILAPCDSGNSFLKVIISISVILDESVNLSETVHEHSEDRWQEFIFRPMKWRGCMSFASSGSRDLWISLAESIELRKISVVLLFKEMGADCCWERNLYTPDHEEVPELFGSYSRDPLVSNIYDRVSSLQLLLHKLLQLDSSFLWWREGRKLDSR